MVPVPATALVGKHDGADVVFVLSDGSPSAQGHRRRPHGSEALVASGLTNGDQVVSSGAEGLKDGMKASQ